MHEIRLPKLGETMEEAELIEWVAQEGEQVDAHQALVVIQTEKTSYEMESQYAGILHIMAPIEETIPVNQLIAILADTPEEYEEIKNRK